MNAPMKSQRLTLDPAYIRWRLEFESFEVTCFGEFCDFVRLHFDDLLDGYYGDGHESLNAFAGWAFERYLQDVEGTGSREHLE
jgi:hypothetical protein